MSLKLIFGFISTALALVSFFPYIKDVVAKKTTPHMYSWLIWSILPMTAALAILQENTLPSALGVLANSLVSFCVFLLCFKYGTKNITYFDILCLIGAFVAIGAWVITDNILLSVILVTLTDFIGFLPTYRKGYEEPWSETASMYLLSGISNICALIAIENYSLTSSFYVASLVLTNAICVSILLFRRKTFSKVPIN
jgi:hypothetical protein